MTDYSKVYDCLWLPKYIVVVYSQERCRESTTENQVGYFINSESLPKMHWILILDAAGMHSVDKRCCAIVVTLSLWDTFAEGLEDESPKNPLNIPQRNGRRQRRSPLSIVAVKTKTIGEWDTWRRRRFNAFLLIFLSFQIITQSRQCSNVRSPMLIIIKTTRLLCCCSSSHIAYPFPSSSSVYQCISPVFNCSTFRVAFLIYQGLYILIPFPLLLYANS